VAARAHLLFDFRTGEVLAESNIEQKMEPASLSKIMTVYVIASELAEGNIRLDDLVLVSEKAWRTKGSRMFIEVGKQVSVKDLLAGIVVQSGNDASVALAEHISGSEEVFAQLMNLHAQRLGLDGTHFVNSTGLPHPENYITPHDIGMLAAALIRDFPDIYALFSIKDFTYNKIKQPNRNRLLWQDESVDGVKTGHTESAGYSLVVSAEREGMRLVSVVLGTDNEQDRVVASQALLNYGFRFFETHHLYKAHEPLTSVRVWKGDPPSVDLGLSEDLYVTIPRHQYEDLKAVMDLEPQIIAPLDKGEQRGTLSLTLGGAELLQRSLIALQGVPEGGLWDRLADQLRLLLQ
jgi:D-alanyl-D-alanine carboxypeptidase (penicillin-binding protein 5/6)